MSSNRKKLLLLIQIMFFTFLLSSCELLMEEADNTSITVGNVSRVINTKNVLLIDDYYLYHDFDGIYKIENAEKEKIFNTEGNTYIAAYNDSIIIRSELSNDIYQIGLDGTVIKQVAFSGVCDSMYVINDILYCTDRKENLVKAYDISKDFREIPMDHNFFSSQFIIKKPYNDEEWFAYEDETSTILSTRTPHGLLAEANFIIFQGDELQPAFEFGEDKDFYYQYDSTELLNFSLQDAAIIQYDINTQKSSYYHQNLYRFQIAKENIVIEDQVIVAIVRNVFNSKIGCSPKLSEHKKDTLLIIDKEDKKALNMIDTRKRERILYADSKSAITYYEGKLNTYDVDSWQITMTTDASFITKDNEYYFETCHDKLFVFENSKLIEIFDFKELL